MNMVIETEFEEEPFLFSSRGGLWDYIWAQICIEMNQILGRWLLRIKSPKNYNWRGKGGPKVGRL